jgi:hypothetical protein
MTVLNREEIASQHNCYPPKRIAMPRHSLAGGKAQATHRRGSVVKEKFVRHRDPYYAASAPTLQCAIRSR